jgi:hypothetical protein
MDRQPSLTADDRMFIRFAAANIHAALVGQAGCRIRPERRMSAL